MDLVVTGQFGGGPGARGGVGLFRGLGEDVGGVGGGAAGQGDVGVLAVFGAGDDGQAGGDGAALGGVVGDGVAEFGVVVTGVGESAAGPAALPGLGVGVQGAADEQGVVGDRVDAE